MRIAHNRQSFNALGINYGHALSQGLVFYACIQGNQLIDLVSGNAAAAIGSGSSFTIESWNVGTARQTDNGVLCATNTSSGGWQWGLGKTGLDGLSIASGSPKFSLLALHKHITASSISDSFGSYESVVVGDGVGLSSDDFSFVPVTGAIALRAQGGALTTYTVSQPAGELTTSPPGKLHFYGSCFNGTNRIDYFQGNRVYDSAIAGYTNGSNGPRQTNFGQVGYNGTGFRASSTALALAYNRVLSLQEYALLHANPWQIIRNQQRSFFFAGAQAANSGRFLMMGVGD